jgi:hypothetical protein
VGAGRRTEVLDKNFLAGCDSLNVQKASSAILEGLLGGRIIDAQAVIVANIGLLGDQDLEILDGGIVGQVDRGRELLNRLLESCERNGSIESSTMKRRLS